MPHSTVRAGPSALGLLAPLLALAQSPEGSWFGSYAAFAGDVDGDGREDVIVAEQDRWYRGLAWVISGADRRVLHRLETAELGSGWPAHPVFGSVRPAGDVDGDGRDDLLVRQRGKANGDEDRGPVWHVVSGADAHLIRAHGVADGVAWQAVAGADWTCDGRKDLALVGQDGIRIVEGESGAPVREFRPSTASAHLGESLAVVGDVDGDGMRDLACFERRPGWAGDVVVLSVASAEPVLRWGVGSNGYPNLAFCNAGDVDLDGRDDFAVGTTLCSTPRRERESVRIHSGANGRVLLGVTDASLDDEIDPEWDANFGSVLANAGDLDGDGACEIVMGAESLNLSGGGFAILSAGTGQVLVVEDQPGRGDGCPRFGSGIDAGADWDADGMPDWVVSSGSITGGPGIGKVLIYSGRTLSVLEEITRESLGL